MKALYFGVIAAASVVSFSHCQKTGVLTKYGIFHVKNDSTITMNGTIGGRTDNHFNNLIEDYPNVKWVELGNCPGSKNDEVNLQVAIQMHDLGINTRLYSYSEIASGAVDLFLAGNNREIELGAMIGVHSWSGGGKEANQLTVDDPEHNLYIDFYKSIGMSDSASREFYFFTINAADASDIHWMTQDEIEYYNMSAD